MTLSIRDAAEARRARPAQQGRAARPSQRRCAAEVGSSAVVRAAAVVQLREAVDDSGISYLDFEGMASVTEQAYEMWDMFGPYNEIVSAGAFATTLNRADLDVPLVLGHDQLRRIARTTNGTLDLAEITGANSGLRSQARLDPGDADVTYISPKLRNGLINEMSFAFRIVRGQWSPDFTEYHIEEVDIHRGDVSIVGWGANPFTSAGLREPEPAEDERAAGPHLSRAAFDLLTFGVA